MKGLEKYVSFAASVAGGVLLAGFVLYTFRANGRTLFQVSAKHVIDLLNKYYGVAFTAGQIVIPLARPWMRKIEVEEKLSWGTLGLNSLAIEVDVSPGAVSPSLEAFADIDPITQRELGGIIQVQKQEFSSAVSGLMEVRGLGTSNGNLIALHCENSNITKIEAFLNKATFLDADLDVVKSLYTWNGERTPQAGYVHVDACFGEFLRCLSASASFDVSLNDDAAVFFDAGIEYRLDAPQQFANVRLINSTATPIPVIMAWGYGELRDGRFALNGSVNSVITNTPTVTVGNPTAISTPLSDTLKNDRLQRAPLTTLAGATHAGAKNSTNAVVSGAANVNGVIIRHAVLCGDFATQTGHILVGGNYLMRGEGAGTTVSSPLSLVQKDIFVPAGASIELFSGSTGIRADIWYEVL